MDFDLLLSKYSATHLICDGNQPLITDGTFSEEAMLYDLAQAIELQVISIFAYITDKAINSESDISQLSGGQKVVLMVLLALHSKAEKIVFINVTPSLDLQRKQAIQVLIEKFKPAKQEILQLDQI